MNNAAYWRKRLAELEKERARLDLPIAEARSHLKNAEAREAKHEVWVAKLDALSESEKLERWLSHQRGIGKVRIERLRPFLESRKLFATAVHAGLVKLPIWVVDEIEAWDEWPRKPESEESHG
jgi:hypothetical protein